MIMAMDAKEEGNPGEVPPSPANLARRLRALGWRRALGLAGGLALAAALIATAAWYGAQPEPQAAEQPEAIAEATVAPAYGGPISLPDYAPSTFPIGDVRRQAQVYTVIPERPRIKITTYEVQRGDTLFGIAEKFGLRPETILWGNFDILQDNPHSLRPGQTLNILPVDGTYYIWNAGDNLQKVADFFGVDVRAILDWPGNQLEPDLELENPAIEPGTGLVIPGGRREFVSWRAPRITRANPAVAKIAGPGACGSIYDGPVGEGYFIWPTPANYLSGYNYSDFHPGLDIAGAMGNAIYASASGVVVYAGWNNYGYGYMVVVDHGDGWQTLYAHMSQVSVVCGQAVFQGNVVGRVGSSGNSTGPHLHFEMQHDLYGKVNPYSYVSPP